jgi:hypothetical protein
MMLIYFDIYLSYVSHDDVNYLIIIIYCLPFRLLCVSHVDINLVDVGI